MTATCEIRRPSSASTYDETAGKSVYPAPTVLATSPCRVQRLPMRGGDQPVGDRNITLQRYQINVPADISDVRVNDQIVVTTSTDTSLVGAVVRVREIRLGTLRWQRDLICDEDVPTTR